MQRFKNMDKGILTDIDMKQKRYKILYFVMFAIMLVFCAIALVPSLWMVFSGFKTIDEFYAVPPKFFPEKIELSKALNLWNEMKFYKYYINTFIMAGGSVLADLVVSGLAGYVLSRLKPKGSGVVFKIVFWLMLMPSVSIVPMYMMFIDFPILHLNMSNTYLPIWIMAAANCFNIILFKNFFDGISTSFIEAAKVDGATNFYIFVRIIIPLSIPVFVTVSVLAFNHQIGQFLWPLLLISDKSLYVLGLQLFKMGEGIYTMDEQLLALFFSVIPQIVVFALFQKHIMGGVNVGGVKG